MPCKCYSENNEAISPYNVYNTGHFHERTPVSSMWVRAMKNAWSENETALKKLLMPLPFLAKTDYLIAHWLTKDKTKAVINSDWMLALPGNVCWHTPSFILSFIPFHRYLLEKSIIYTYSCVMRRVCVSAVTCVFSTCCFMWYLTTATVLSQLQWEFSKNTKKQIHMHLHTCDLPLSETNKSIWNNLEASKVIMHN